MRRDDTRRAEMTRRGAQHKSELTLEPLRVWGETEKARTERETGKTERRTANIVVISYS